MTFSDAVTAAPKPNRRARRRAEKQARKGGAGGKQRAPSVGPQSSAVIALLQQAIRHHQSGEPAAAERLYRDALDREPNNPNALRLLGTILQQQGRNDRAIALFERAVAAAPQIPDSWNNLGVACAALGRQDAAIRHYEKAIALRPDYADAHRNLGSLRFNGGAYEAAVRHLEAARAQNRDDTGLLILLATARLRTGDAASAVAEFREALRLAPDNLAAQESLVLALTELKQPAAALDIILEALPRNPDSRALQRLFEQVLQAAPPTSYRPELERALLLCFDRRLIFHRTIARHAANQIRLKYQAQRKDEVLGEADGAAPDQRGLRVQFEGILGDELLIRMLESVVNVDLPLEFFLIPLRRSLLFSAPQEPEISQQALRFVAALAIQCHHNSYIFCAETDEIGEILQLRREIEQTPIADGRPDAALEVKLALFGLYESLSKLANRAALSAIEPGAWSEALRPLIQTTLLDPLEETAIKQALPSLSAIADATSQAVRSQYEENPYPRWFTLPQQGPVTLAEYLQQQIPEYAPPDMMSGELELLVAGSGTGQHPLSLAEMLSNVSVVAVDLSLASLAYAQRMARRHEIANISFQQGDILQISALGRQFPVIECSGVLHHMKDPDAGLAALTGMLLPGGVMKLGLYSELARQWVVKARARIAELGLEPTAENIRRFRRAIITGQELPGCDLSRFSDFHDLDSFRDLVFHVQEHRYTITGLRDFMAGQDLEFLGFSSTDRSVLNNFSSVFPEAGERALSDLTRWQQVEEAYPATFMSMYQFWCRKPL